MKRFLTITALAAFGLAPALSPACEFDDSMASVTPPEKMGVAAAPVASKPNVLKSAKADAAKGKQQTAAKKQAVSDAKVAAAASTN